MPEKLTIPQLRKKELLFLENYYYQEMWIDQQFQVNLI